ncbi:hypothetical protein U0070_008307, partial [Myodes glareolus]
QLDYINSRAVQLGSLLVRGLTMLILVNSACGFPWTTSEFMPWNVFDGKLFHQKYLQSEKGYAVEVLLEQNRSWLTKFHNLKAVVCKACSKENRRIGGWGDRAPAPTGQAPHMAILGKGSHGEIRVQVTVQAPWSLSGSSINQPVYLGLHSAVILCWLVDEYKSCSIDIPFGDSGTQQLNKTDVVNKVWTAVGTLIVRSPVVYWACIFFKCWMIDSSVPKGSDGDEGLTPVDSEVWKDNEAPRLCPLQRLFRVMPPSRTSKE